MFVTDVRAIAPEPSTRLVHLVDANVVCGFPSPAQDYKQSEVDLNDVLMLNRQSSFVARVYDGDMPGAGIWDGDTLIFDRSVEDRDGRVAVVELDGELEVKRIRVGAGGVTLDSEDPGRPPVHVPELSELRVLGIVLVAFHPLHPSADWGSILAPRGERAIDVDLNELLMPRRTSTFVLRADGHSMQGAGIWHGDELVVDRALRDRDGRIAVVELDNSLAVKRLQVEGGGVVLSSENEAYAPIRVPELSELFVWGLVVAVIHHVR